MIRAFSMFADRMTRADIVIYRRLIQWRRAANGCGELCSPKSKRRAAKVAGSRLNCNESRGNDGGGEQEKRGECKGANA